MELKNFIKVYDDVIPQAILDSLIKKFDTVECKRVYDHTKFYNFRELIINEHLDVFGFEFEETFKRFNNCVDNYKKDVPLASKWFPEKYGYEMFKLKRYTKADGYFKEHVDVTGPNTCKRFFSFFCYLNDGGGTRFTDIDFNVESKPGRLLMFPPMWMFPHEAIVSNEVDKFILHTYFHYV